MSTATEQLHHTRVAAGYKAALTNPNISEAAKEHARQQLEVLAQYVSDDDKNQHNNHVLGGFKAALHNPNTSEDAKQHARQVLEAAGLNPDDLASAPTEGTTEGAGESHKEQLTSRVLAGYKATLHNPKTSEEAKAHAREVLQKEGAL